MAHIYVVHVKCSELCFSAETSIIGNVGPYVIVSIYDSCAAGCNQEPVHAVVAQVVSRCNGFANAVQDDGRPGGP